MSDPMKGLSPEDSKGFLTFALTHPTWSHATAVLDIRNIMLDAVRSKSTVATTNGDGTRQEIISRAAYVKVQIDDQIVAALRGLPEDSPYVFLMAAIPTQALQEPEPTIVGLDGRPVA